MLGHQISETEKCKFKYGIFAHICDLKTTTHQLKIAVNTRLLIKDKLEGIGWFTYETMKRICHAHPEHEFFFLFDRKYDDEFIFSQNITPLVIPPPTRHPVLQYIWFEKTLPRKLEKIKPDVFISPDAYCSLKTKVKTLIAIHDLNFEHFPEYLPWSARKYYRYFTPLFAKKADRIATVSEYSKQDIVTQYGIDPHKIDVVYNGANQLYKPVDDEQQRKTREKLTGGKNYFVFIGALNPRKNLNNLFKAFDIFKKARGSDYKLVIVGEKMYWPANIKTTFDGMNHKEDVVFTGRLGVKELARVIGSASALTFVSLFEGFGIPIIEAFNAGTPVITSNVTSMPEIAADAALYADPNNLEEIADAMEKIVSDTSLSQQLISRGFQVSKNFSWDKSADQLWNSVMKTV